MTSCCDFSIKITLYFLCSPLGFLMHLSGKDGQSSQNQSESCVRLRSTRPTGQFTDPLSKPKAVGSVLSALHRREERVEAYVVHASMPMTAVPCCRATDRSGW